MNLSTGFQPASSMQNTGFGANKPGTGMFGPIQTTGTNTGFPSTNQPLGNNNFYLGTTGGAYTFGFGGQQSTSVTSVNPSSFGQQVGTMVNQNQNLFGQPTGQLTGQSVNQTGSLFGQGTSSGFNFFKPTTTQGTGLLQPQTTMTTQQPQQVQQTIPQITTPILLLPQSNSFRYDKVESSSEDAKAIFKDIETSFQQNLIHLENAETMFKDMTTLYTSIFLPLGAETINYTKVTSSKKLSTNYIIETMRSEIEKEYHFSEKSKRNYSRLTTDPSRIVTPSSYFLTLLEQLEEKLQLQIQQAAQIEAIINLHLGKEYGSFKVNSDILEETICAIYQCLMGVTTEAAKINERINYLAMNYINYLKNTYKKSEQEVENYMRIQIEQIEKGHSTN